MATFCLHLQQNQEWQILDKFTMKSLTRSGASASTCSQASLCHRLASPRVSQIHNPTISKIEGPLVGPFVSLLSFVRSVESHYSGNHRRGAVGLHQRAQYTLPPPGSDPRRSLYLHGRPRIMDKR